MPRDNDYQLVHAIREAARPMTTALEPMDRRAQPGHEEEWETFPSGV